MKVIPLKYYDNGFMTQAFAFGGSRDKEKCEDVKYGSSLQNFRHQLRNSVEKNRI